MRSTRHQTGAGRDYPRHPERRAGGRLKDLDDRAALSAWVRRYTRGDILVGKVTPKGETELTAEERLLSAQSLAKRRARCAIPRCVCRMVKAALL